MTFDKALLEVAKGNRVTRAGWHNVTMYLKVWDALQSIETMDGTVNTIVQVIGFPYTVDGQGSPVTMAPQDMLETDWEIVP